VFIDRYKALIECDRIVLYSFLTEHSVSSFRANELSDEFVNKEEENQEKMNFAGAGAFLAGQSTYRKSSMGKRKTSTLVEEQEKEEQAAQAQKQQQTPNQPAQKLEGKVAKMIEKAEQRKQKRIARQKEWEELYKNQPDENYEDPEDCEAIALAQQTIGDFKLKTAADFVVPENERVNAEKKRSELFSLIRQTHDMKKKFNDKLLMLRNRKIESIAEIKELVDKLEIVQSYLPKRCHVTLPAVPEMKPEEEPEKKLEYTKETLIEFRKNVLGLEITRVDENSTTNTVPAIETHTSKATTRATNDPRLRSASILSTFSSLPPSGSSVMYETPDMGEGGRRDFEQDDNEDEKSEFQLMIEKEQEIRLTYERDELLREIREKLILFDAVLRLLRHEKVNLDTILKNAELRKVTLFEECMLLKDFEKRENGLAEKVYTKMQERDELEDKTDELKDSLDEQKEELEQLQEREGSLTVTLNNTIGDGNKFESFLIKMYKKKIKRIKKKASNEGSSEENSEEDDSDDDYDDSDDSDVDSDDDEMDDTVCPPGCDPAIYDQICALRERRLDLEDALLEAKKLCDGMKKELDAMTKKVKVVDGALKNARSDLEAFQREKQQKLNELDVVVTLKLDQIQYVLNNALPQDLSKCLIIRGSFLNRLQRRIKELEREKVTQKQLYKERRQQHVQMLRDKKTMQKKIKELEERVQQIQLLKFGRLVDLEKLETVSVNRVAEELKEKLRMQEEQNIRDLNNWDKTIDQLQSELTVHVKENTKRLDTYTVLHRANRELEVSLDARQKNLGSEFQGDRMADEIERTRLAQLVQMQSSEIQQLEDEINMLSRKGGHVLPPHRNTQLPREKNNNSYR
uniref:Uncharacterized protein n=1 Tax=Clytia hemisphaerica TaxID=252671 RepID=A0A7M5XG43_9CNID